MHSLQLLQRNLARGCLAALGGASMLTGTPAATVDTETMATAAAPDYFPPLTGRELFTVDEPMRQFFNARVHRDGSSGARLQEIVDAIVGPEGLNFAYEVMGTYDARETFHRRRGNCQAFSFLVAAVAREYGLEVRFQDLETFQNWNRYGRFIASVRHLNVRMTGVLESYVVDLRPDLGRPTFTDTRYVVSDEHAIAQFYSTAGFFRLVAGDAQGALRLMKLGTEIDPRMSTVWANLGSLHSQLGDLPAARSCFEKALKLNSREESALTGLVDTLRRQGGPEELKLAEKYELKAQRYRDKNPYFAYHLATLATEGSEWAAAEKQLRRAIRLKDDEPIFHEALVEVLRRQGHEQDARKAEAKLEKLRRKLEDIILPHIR